MRWCCSRRRHRNDFFFTLFDINCIQHTVLYLYPVPYIIFNKKIFYYYNVLVVFFII